MNDFRLQASQRPKKIVFPEANDERILLAVDQIVNQKVAHPIFIGDVDRIEQSAKNLGLELNQITIFSPTQSPQFD
jgi:phosphotransacetylase